MRKLLQIFRDDNRISQIRFNIPTFSNEIQNLKLIFSKRHFNKRVILFYERHKFKPNKKVIEYYTNTRLESYSEMKIVNNKKITKTFSSKGIAFAKETIKYNSNGSIFSISNRVENMDGTTTKSKNIINQN
ncbi:MAG: hypothetical protein KDC52_17460 [Ignavibacteriae bacterium]|nr:hypothetical protein [Ignavibacteriota bacterium]MCB0753263.1 hypothetical protein [Ignavibacteriota bacterium]